VTQQATTEKKKAGVFSKNLKAFLLSHKTYFQAKIKQFQTNSTK
jgi:hypothetical protein